MSKHTTRARDEATFRRDIEKWDWDTIILKTDDNAEDGDCGERYGRFFLGTVFGIMLSGKYYLPFACGNLDLCYACKGSGHKRRSRAMRLRLKKWEARRVALGDAFTIARKHGFSEARLRRKSDRCMAALKRNGMQDCGECRGVGSIDAAEDEAFMAALEDIADDHGGWIEGNEGDPCNMVFSMRLEDTGDTEK